LRRRWPASGRGTGAPDNGTSLPQQAYYIGDDLAAEGVAVVSANYRLGAFGFLATDELADESDDGSHGNYGLADQTATLFAAPRASPRSRRG
jgi:carboxylesterase type B